MSYVLEQISKNIPIFLDLNTIGLLWLLEQSFYKITWLLILSQPVKKYEDICWGKEKYLYISNHSDLMFDWRLTEQNSTKTGTIFWSFSCNRNLGNWNYARFHNNTDNNSLFIYVNNAKKLSLKYTFHRNVKKLIS